MNAQSQMLTYIYKYLEPNVDYSSDSFKIVNKYYLHHIISKFNR